jgi:hypothetical protein
MMPMPMMPQSMAPVAPAPIAQPEPVAYEYAQPLQPAQPQQVHQTQLAQPVPPIATPSVSMAPANEGPHINLNGSAVPETQSEKPLPRDLLLAKVRQYRENQAKRVGAPEQLSMDVEGPESSLEAARRLASEIVRSPFDPKNLDVPTFLRRKAREEENENANI